MLKQVSCKEMKQLMSDRDPVIADVRDLDSYNQEHIDNAIHLSVPMLQEFCQQADKSLPILVYCYHGITSQSVAQHLVDQGFTEVYSLTGGFEVWRENHSAS